MYALLDPTRPYPFYHGLYSFEAEPFYIGKGTGRRVKAHLGQAKKMMREGVVPDEEEEAKLTYIIGLINLGLEPIHHIIRDCLNEYESFELEAELIQGIGRVATKRGPLVNENDGNIPLTAPPLVLAGTTGMNNTVIKDADVTTPRVILNADVMHNGQCRKKRGVVRKIPLAGSHSLFSTTIDGKQLVLVCAKNTIYKVEDASRVVAIGVSTGPEDARMSFAVFDGEVYMTNGHWHGMLSAGASQVSEWGIPSPEMPVVIAVPGGNLPAGRYLVCATFSDHTGRHSPSSAAAFVNCVADGSSIQILNGEPGAFYWVTDPNGDVFNFVGPVAAIHHIPTASPLFTYNALGPIPGQRLASGLGRVWIAAGRQLYASDPYLPHIFRMSGVISFDDEITELIPVSAGESFGLFVGTKTKTYFLSGTDPSQFSQQVVGTGIVAYSGSIVATPASPGTAACWIDVSGQILIGSASGEVKSITREAIRFTPGPSGATMYRDIDGVPQIIASFESSKGGDTTSAGFSDAATCEVVRRGSVISHP